MSQKRVLLVSGNSSQRKLVKNALNHGSGYIVQSFSVTEKAISLLNKRNFQIVICDDHLDSMEGIDFLKKVKEIRPGSVRLLITRPDRYPVHNTIKEKNVFHYCLSKPLVPQIIAATVQHAGEYWELRAQNALFKEQLRRIDRKEKHLEAETIHFEQEKKRFMLIANHEFRTPLTLISTALQLLESQMGSLPPMQQRLMATAQEGVRRLTEILGKINCITGADHSIKKETVNIHDLISSIIARQEHHIRERHIRIHFRVSKKLTIWGCREQLNLLFINLLSNAIKFTPDHGQVEICAKSNGSFCYIAFRDNGVGIPSKYREQIFKPFYQLGHLKNHSTSSYKFKGNGTGLGLTLCRKVVEKHNGRIWVESAGTDKGSTFCIKLPLVNVSVRNSAQDEYPYYLDN